jgi:hypothetical protein
MGNGGRILLAVVNFYVRIKISVATFDADNLVTDNTPTVTASDQKLPDSVVVINLRLAVDFYM